MVIKVENQRELKRGSPSPYLKSERPLQRPKNLTAARESMRAKQRLWELEWAVRQGVGLFLGSGGRERGVKIRRA